MLTSEQKIDFLFFTHGRHDGNHDTDGDRIDCG